MLAGAAGSPGSPGMAGSPGDRGVQGRRGRKGAEGIRYTFYEHHVRKIQYSCNHKVLPYVEYRAVFSVFQNIDPPTPLFTQRVCPPPAPRAGGGVNILDDARHRIGLLQYNLSTVVMFN